jgi:hypothetical protein
MRTLDDNEVHKDNLQTTKHSVQNHYRWYAFECIRLLEPIYINKSVYTFYNSGSRYLQ